MKKINPNNFNRRIARIITFFIIFSIFNLKNIPSSAITLSPLDQNRMLGATAKDWQSSNIREWLNSNKDVVDYTAIAPTYKAEAGFLSNKNFTQEEQDNIAITKNSQGWQAYIRNYANTPYMSQKSVVHNDFSSNDKVFILNYSDISYYIERNNLLLDYNTKYYSNYLQNQTNKTSKYSYLVNSGYYDSSYSGNELYTSKFEAVHGKDSQNIVPALHLKPDFTLSNGVKAKDLPLNSKVYFGKYNGEPIEWQVINKTNNGYPLLWSTKILTTKQYDANGDINPPTSSYINYSSYDIDIFSNSQAHSFLTGNNVDSTPVITIKNLAEVQTPTNSDHIIVQIQATDAHHSVSQIILPNGSTINGDYGEWNCLSNGEYDIKAINTEGILTVKHIVINSINKPANVIITTDKTSDSKWSNRPVSVNISTSNQDASIRTISSKIGTNGASSSNFPSGYPYAGKKFRITGTLYNALTESEQTKVDMSKSVAIYINSYYTDGQLIGPTWPGFVYTSLQQLKDAGTTGVTIDSIITVPNNYYDYKGFNFTVGIQGGINYTNTADHPYKFSMSDFKMELLDADPLAISEIDMPDGTIVKAQQATYVIATAGSYTFSVKDNLGKITSKTIDLAVDTIAPNVAISTPSGFTKSQIIHISATDDTSGIKSLKLPNGEYRENSIEGQSLDIDYNIIDNGTYIFEATDFAGNITTKSITINNIDKTNPSLVLSQNPATYTTGSVTISATATDAESGVSQIQLPNGTWINGSTASYTVNTNGTYQFSVKDNVGNITTKSITISNIDRNPPVLTISKISEWSNSSVIINVKATDNESGTKYIILPDGSTITGDTATYIVNDIGVYYFKAVDMVGNTGVNYIIVNIDKTKPTVTISNNKNWSNLNSENVTISASDK